MTSDNSTKWSKIVDSTKNREGIITMIVVKRMVANFKCNSTDQAQYIRLIHCMSHL